MRIGYLHCFSGISGDMFLGALVDAGVSVELFRETAQRLRLGADLKFERVDRSGLSAIKIDVLEPAHDHSHDSASHTHDHDHTHSHDAAEHVHGRSLFVIRELIQQASLAPEVKQIAISAFEFLGAAEAKMHDVPIEEVHFHEVGAVDAIVDIVCGSAGAFSLGVDRWICSPLNVGSGMVRCAHGVFPIPAPATLELLHGAPIYSEGPEGERVTPTGAALIRALGCSFGSVPSMTATATGYGAGSRNTKDYPNVLRLTLGEIQPDSTIDEESIAVLETAIDDSTPQVLAYLSEAALAAGALDVMMTPVHMKKNRLGTMITILCEPADRRRFQDLLFRETSTIGVRSRLEHRQRLQRGIVSVETEWGEVRLKVARLNGVVVNSAPEFEDCRRIALLHHVPLKDIQRAAILEFEQIQVDEARETLESGASKHS
jgi:hypothetical protein